MTRNDEVALVRRGKDSLSKRMEPLEESELAAADIYESADAYIIRADMPGVQKDSISVIAEPGQLQIKGKIGRLYEENLNLIDSEICKASIYRKFNIGDGIDIDAIHAGFEDGVLTVTLPKNELMRVREISIK